MAIGFINLCCHSNYSPNVVESSHQIVVALRYNLTYRLAYCQFDEEQPTTSYYPTSKLITVSSPLNPHCPHCVYDLERDFMSGVYGTLPVDTTVNDTVCQILKVVAHKVQSMAHKLRNETTPRILEGVTSINKCHNLHWMDPRQVAEAAFLESGWAGLRPNPATEWAVEELERVEADDDDVAADEDCVVCLEALMSDVKNVELVRMPCEHVFHEECIVEWLRNSHVCPLCRFELPVEDD